MNVWLYGFQSGRYRFKRDADCRTCKHVHVSWDTSPWNEACCVSIHESVLLNRNQHFHHYDQNR